MDLWNRLSFRYSIWVLVITGSLVVILLDWPLGNANNFYLDHPVIAGLISSAISVGIGATAARAYLDHQTNNRWRAASQVAYNSLSRAPLAQRRVMWFLLYGGSYVGDRDFVLDDFISQDIDRILSQNNLDQLSEAGSFMGGRPDFEGRLKKLVQDDDWQLTAYAALRDSSHGFRGVIARWASILSSSPQGQQTLGYIVRQEKELTDLYIKLVPVARRGITLDSITRDEFSEAWHRAFANAVVLNEYLARMGQEYGNQTTNLGRHLLNSEQREALFERESREKTVSRLYGE